MADNPEKPGREKIKAKRAERLKAAEAAGAAVQPGGEVRRKKKKRPVEGEARPLEAGARPPKGPKTPTAVGGNGTPRPDKGGKPVTAEQSAKMRTWWQRLQKYFKSVRAEFHRITWPSKSELRAATIVVIATLIVVTLYLYVVNLILTAVFNRVGA